jgi:hypothetical protein
LGAGNREPHRTPALLCESAMERQFFLRAQANRCRRMARTVTDRLTQDRLEQLAGEYEAQADAEDAAGLAAARRTGSAEG